MSFALHFYIRLKGTRSTYDVVCGRLVLFTQCYYSPYIIHVSVIIVLPRTGCGSGTIMKELTTLCCKWTKYFHNLQVLSPIGEGDKCMRVSHAHGSHGHFCVRGYRQEQLFWW